MVLPKKEPSREGIEGDDRDSAGGGKNDFLEDILLGLWRRNLHPG